MSDDDICRCGEPGRCPNPHHVTGDGRYIVSGPKPNPSAAAVSFRTGLPTVRVVPSINEALLDIRSLLKEGLDQLKRKGGQLTPMDVRTLQGLARVAETTQRMDKEAREQLLTELAKLTDEQVEAAAADPSKLLEGK